jgi:hydroxymethylpyrimidine pyrophosphatase-like HAD family hydrolase
VINLSKTPRLVATDLDGTLVRSDETVSPRSMAVLKRLAASGIIVVGATGRGPRLLEMSRDDIPSADFLVMAQGAFVYECRYDESTVEMSRQVIDGETLHKALRRIEADTGPLRALAEPADPDLPLSGDPMPRWPWPAVTLVPAPREEAFAGPIVKAYFVSDYLGGHELLEAAEGVVDRTQVSVTESGVGMLEVCPAGVSKAAGLQVVLDKFDLDWDDVLAFGDAMNDLSMLRAAGHSVVMPHAHDRVKAAADEIAPGGNNDDGVARYLEELVERF